MTTTSRAAFIRSLRARGITSYREVVAACAEAAHANPSRQAVSAALKPRGSSKGGRPRTKTHIVDTVRELVEAYAKARSRVTITERMRNALNVLEAQLREQDDAAWRNKNSRLAY